MSFGQAYGFVVISGKCYFQVGENSDVIVNYVD